MNFAVHEKQLTPTELFSHFPVVVTTGGTYTDEAAGWVAILPNAGSIIYFSERQNSGNVYDIGLKSRFFMSLHFAIANPDAVIHAGLYNNGGGNRFGVASDGAGNLVAEFPDGTTQNFAAAATTDIYRVALIANARSLAVHLRNSVTGVEEILRANMAADYTANRVLWAQIPGATPRKCRFRSEMFSYSGQD